jgi:hypothetical protein
VYFRDFCVLEMHQRSRRKSVYWFLCDKKRGAIPSQPHTERRIDEPFVQVAVAVVVPVAAVVELTVGIDELSFFDNYEQHK